MQLRNKYYAYPTVEAKPGKYVTTQFTSNVDLKKDAYKFLIEFENSVNNERINKMIQDGELAFLFHIECPQTSFRLTHVTNETSTTKIVEGKYLNGVVQICSFIIALKDIENFSDEDFSADYKGSKFNIGKNCIFGIGEQSNFDIQKKENELTGASSIFSIVPELNENIKSVQINVNSKDKIKLKLPKEVYYKYKNMGSQRAMYPIFNTMVFLPAMIYVLKELQGDFENYQENKWLKSLQKTYKNVFGSELNASTIGNIEVYEKAQKLLKEPYEDAFAFLARGIEE